MTTKTRRRDTEEFKAEAVRLMRESAQPLHRWRGTWGLRTIGSTAGCLGPIRSGGGDLTSIWTTLDKRCYLHNYISNGLGLCGFCQSFR